MDKQQIINVGSNYFKISDTSVQISCGQCSIILNADGTGSINIPNGDLKINTIETSTCEHGECSCH